MPLYIASLAFQLLFAAHAWRTGRDRTWLWIILIFPGVGCLLYFCVEILPEMLKGKEAQDVRQWLEQRKDPDKAVRHAQQMLATTPTVANRLKLAQALMARQDYAGVIAALEPALVGHFADDPTVLEGLAYAHHFQGDHAKALAYAEQVCQHEAWTPKDYIKLLRAKLLHATGAVAAARAAYETLVKSYAGEEARIAYAGFLEAQGDAAAAKEIYADIVKRARHTPKHYQQRERGWIEQA